MKSFSLAQIGLVPVFYATCSALLVVCKTQVLGLFIMYDLSCLCRIYVDCN